ncbi:FMN-dependent NADH-azoreductase [Levilactobacillus zymae]|uniref:FMN-dependent NADH-azoreductase n=1 Tax=Levilactobacillus zymae TaxID=267363 RepID=UPI003FCDADFD
MKILLINAHPDYQNPQRTINQLTATAQATIAAQAPHAEVETLTLYDPATQIPRITAETLAATEMSPVQRHLIDQWKAADLTVILMPLHNFNVVSKLKDYIDKVFIAGETFKYTADGSVGLLSNQHKVVYVQSSGSDYAHDFRYVTADIAPYYLRTIMSLMGITAMEVIRAQGLDLANSDKPAIVEATKHQLSAYLTKALAATD